jgi:O-methyltransferase involved in polyketide biosynthesis
MLLHAQAPTLVLAECVLVYLDAAEAAGVVAALGSLLPNAVFAVYEQVMHMKLGAVVREY